MKIWVTVRPRARADEVRRTIDGDYSAAVREPAREGKANRALVALLADHFSVPRSAVRIVRGHAGRRKLVEILTPGSARG